MCQCGNKSCYTTFRTYFVHQRNYLNKTHLYEVIQLSRRQNYRCTGADGTTYTCWCIVWHHSYAIKPSFDCVRRSSAEGFKSTGGPLYFGITGFWGVTGNASFLAKVRDNTSRKLFAFIIYKKKSWIKVSNK